MKHEHWMTVHTAAWAYLHMCCSQWAETQDLTTMTGLGPVIPAAGLDRPIIGGRDDSLPLLISLLVLGKFLQDNFLSTNYTLYTPDNHIIPF